MGPGEVGIDLRMQDGTWRHVRVFPSRDAALAWANANVRDIRSWRYNDQIIVSPPMSESELAAWLAAQEQT